MLMPACGNAENATYTWVVLWSPLKGLSVQTAFISIILNKSYKITNPTTKRQIGGHSNTVKHTERINSKTYTVNLALPPMRSCIDLCLNVNMNILITSTNLGHTVPSPPLKWIINHKMFPHLFNQTNITQASMKTEPHKTLCFEVTS